MTHPNPVRTLKSYAVEDQTAPEFLEVKSCSPDGTDHHMISIKTSSEMVPYVEQCQNCDWIDGASLNWWAENAIKESLSDRAKRIAVATESQPFAFVQNPHEELKLTEVLGQALGAVSVAWVGGTGSLEFDSSRASAIYKALVQEVLRFQRLEIEEAAARAVEHLNAFDGLRSDEDLLALRKAIEGRE
jgi:hypothetical protein